MTPLSIQEFKNTVQMLWTQGLKDQAKKLESDAQKKGFDIGSCHTEEKLDQFITNDPDMLALKDDVRLLRRVEDSVLIYGPTGTGKELIAQALHGSRLGHFCAINCPALSLDLMESELFGHIKGSFTGAVNDKVGKFQYANNGTLFIDEVGDMPPSMQALLLRVLQERTFCRVGSNEEIQTTARIVCATNKDLEAMVEDGLFREDLYARLTVFRLRTKPLCRRPDDIPLIIRSWDKKNEFDMTLVYPSDHAWNGNVRELWSVFRRYQVLRKV